MKSKTNKRLPPKKLIDRMEESLKLAGHETFRNCFEDNTEFRKDDTCEWLHIILKDANNVKYTIEFFFEDNCNKLAEVNLFKAKPKKGWKNDKLIANKKSMKKEPLIIKEPETPKHTTGDWTTVSALYPYGA